jgi:peptidoglycan L-alanyl-D-glutamate endopeptidase CwlK
MNELKDACAALGYNIKITECFRTVEEQDALYAQGRYTAGKIVTNARGKDFSSMHQWGIAFDICRAGSKPYDNSDHFFDHVGQIGRSLGLEWGGDWKSIKDLCHFQLPTWGSTPAKLKRMYGNPAAFMRQWDVPLLGDDYNKKKAQHIANIKVVQSYVGTYADGIWGKNSRTAMKYALCAATGMARACTTNALIKKLGECKVGTSGEKIKLMQGLLFVVGENPKKFFPFFDEDTEDAVKAFQKAKGLKADGIVGKKTWGALLNV